MISIPSPSPTGLLVKDVPPLPSPLVDNLAGNKDLKVISWGNLGIGAAMQLFEVSTLGQPFEVLKTHLAANRSDSLWQAVRKTWQRGSGSRFALSGFYQGLIPWAWIEASTKGAVLMFVSGETERILLNNSFIPVSKGLAAMLGGMAGGCAQAYTTMGFCTFMKTVEVTRAKQPHGFNKSTWKVAADVWRKEGLRGLNRGVSAVALRQMTNWGSRFGVARLTEDFIQSQRPAEAKNERLSRTERLASAAIGGFLGCWNQPLEVIRVQMQSQLILPGAPAQPTLLNSAQYIWAKDGLRGFYRGVIPRIGLSVYLTVCMVFGGDELKAYFSGSPENKSP